MKRLIIIVCSIISIHIHGQNLINNGDFEEYVFCPRGYTKTSIKELLPFWLIPNKGTTDYFNECGVKESKIPSNYFGKLKSASGKGYVGLHCGGMPNTKEYNKNYREYISMELTQPLIKDSIYCVSFYYAIAPNSQNTINELGVYFSNEKVYVRTDKNLEFIPQVKNLSPLIKSGWGVFCQEYKATIK